MGIKNLNTLLKRNIKDGVITLNLNEFAYQTIAIDTSIYLYKFQYDRGNYLRKFIEQIITFWKSNITPVYIFDGAPPNEKNETLKKRKEIKNKAKKDINTLTEEIHSQELVCEEKKKKINNSSEEESIELLIEVSEIEKNIKDSKTTLKKKVKNDITITAKEISLCKELFNLLGVKYIVANSEADILCCELLNSDVVDCCMSEDMDFLTHGCSKLLKNYDYKNNTVKVYLLPIILKELNINSEQFIDICILCGCDYSNKINGIGPINALKYIKKYYCIEKIITELIDNNQTTKLKIQKNFNYKRAREIFKTKNMSPLEKDDMLVSSINYDQLIHFFKKISLKYSIRKIKINRDNLYKSKNSGKIHT